MDLSTASDRPLLDKFRYGADSRPTSKVTGDRGAGESTLAGIRVDILGPAVGRRDVPAIAADIPLGTLEQHDLLSHVKERRSFEHAP